ncbi:uncharacterized protein LOC129598427 [Paramacrobiotus metropolitanus]|uniref:uncharacterized protein LOC129598427 n=1 Tax=Paramacrobiotus metropolitanus TaxID=2943436 RepID=UPI002446039C|nr:uncharacterized protein LOC129598427 [Paramacrobiotus metropolitanus]
MVSGYTASILPSMSSNKICPVSGVGPRRENSSWYNLRDRDVWIKAGANGKRLRDVLDKSLEQDPKRAVQEIEKLWKKHGGNPPFTVCKAIALHRLDPVSSRVARTCQELVESVPITAELDEFTFHCMVHYFVHEVADYAGLHNFLQKVLAVKKTGVPFLEGILTQYMRNHNPKEIQKVALELCKADPQNADKHYNMAVFSLIMQSFDCAEPARRKVILSLAFRTLDRRFPRPTQETAVKLWCLYEMKDLALYKQYFDLIFEPTALLGEEAMRVFDYLTWYCRLLVMDGQDLDKVDSIMAILSENYRADAAVDILARRHLFDMRTGLGDGLDTEEFVRNLNETINTALDALSSYFPSPGLRHLARLEYFRILLLDPTPYLEFDTKELLDAAIKIVKMKATIWIRDLLVECCTGWIKRTSLYRDLQPYLPLLSVATLKDFTDRIAKATAMAGLSLYDDPPDSLKSVEMVIAHQNLLILDWSFRHSIQTAAPSAENEMLLITKLFEYRLYANEQAPFAVADAPPDMVQLGDNYAILIIYRLFELYRITEDWTFLTDAIVPLEALVRKPKPHNHPAFRLLLIHLYLRCGAIQLAYNHFNGLDIKSLQLNHLGYLMVPSSLVCVLPPQDVYVPDMVVRHYTHSVFEAFESQMALIANQEYFRLIGMEELKHGLKYSSMALMGQFCRLWHLPFYRFVSDVEARSWLLDLDRYLGSVPNMLRMWRDESDREQLMGWDVAFEGTRQSRTESREREEKAWIEVVRAEMVAYLSCVALAATYGRYNPLDSSRPLKDQFLDHVPANQLDSIVEAPAELNKALSEYFDVCKTAMTLPNSEKDLMDHITTSFGLPLREYLSLGCHAVLLRLCHLVLAVDRVVATHLVQFDGTPAYGTADGVNVNDTDKAVGDGDGAVKVEMKLFGEALGTTEISFKLQQMSAEILETFDGAKPEDLGRFKNLLIKLSLFTHVARCIVWVVQCLKGSLVALCSHNEARGKASSKSGDMKKLLDDWCGEFCAFLEMLGDPLEKLCKRLEEMISGPIDVLGTQFARNMRTRPPLGRFEPPDATLDDVAVQTQERMANSYRASLEEISVKLRDSVAVIRHCWEDLDTTVHAKAAKSKAKNAAAKS